MTYEQSLSALRSSTRRGIFEILLSGPLPVGQIAKGVPVSRAAVSQHLKVLWDAGLVRQHREGRQCLYEIEPRGLEPLRTWLDRFWDGALRKFSEQAELDDRLRGCPAPRGGSEDARNSLELAETSAGEAGE